MTEYAPSEEEIKAACLTVHEFFMESIGVFFNPDSDKYEMDVPGYFFAAAGQPVPEGYVDLSVSLGDVKHSIRLDPVYKEDLKHDLTRSLPGFLYQGVVFSVTAVVTPEGYAQETNISVALVDDRTDHIHIKTYSAKPRADDNGSQVISIKSRFHI